MHEIFGSKTVAGMPEVASLKRLCNSLCMTRLKSLMQQFVHEEFVLEEFDATVCVLEELGESFHLSAWIKETRQIKKFVYIIIYICIY